MANTTTITGTTFVIERKNFDTFLSLLKEKGYTTLGPMVRDAAVVYDEVSSSSDFPIGWTDEQEPGKYRLVKRSDNAMFGYVISPQSWKKYLFPPTLKLFSMKKNADGFEVTDINGGMNDKQKKNEVPKLAFIGVRPCEIHAILIQDKVFMDGAYVDNYYKSLREKILIVAVNCNQSASTCFCTSMNTGPKAEGNYDLALTEVINAKEHYFTVTAGSTKGTELLNEMPHRAAVEEDITRANALIAATVKSITKKLDTTNIKQLLYEKFDSPRWDVVADRCMSCSNCTMVCPTCFCSDVEDVTDLTGNVAERGRVWDSCFTMQHSYLHGGSIHASTKARYRQWLTHKLASWIEQFDTSGCVGCGRCTTWCPVGIDITEEATEILKGVKPA